MGTYSNGTVINSSGTATSQLTVAVASPQVVQVASVSGGAKALQLTDNSTSNPACYVKRTFTAVSGTSANNCISGTFSVTPLVTGTGGNPTFQFMINAGSDTGGSTTTAVEVDVRGNGGVTYKTGAGTVDATTLAPGARYSVAVNLDLSGTVQNLWGLTISDTNNHVVYSANNITTRAAVISPDRIVLNGGANPGAANASPFVQINSINFSAVPYNITTFQGPYGDCLLQSNFAAAATGTYADGSIINTNQPAVGRMGVGAASPQVVSVAGTSGSTAAVQFTDNSTTVLNSPMIKKYFAPLGTGATGNNYIAGGFQVTPLGPNPTLQFMINSGYDTGGSTASAVDFEVRGSGAISYFNGATRITGPTLTVGGTYQVEFYLDLSGTAQDTWGFSITQNGTLVSGTTGLNTRAPSLAPDRIVFNGGVNGGALNASPFIQVTNVEFYAYNKPVLAPLPTRIGSGNFNNGLGSSDATTLDQFYVLSGSLHVGMCRSGLYSTYYWKNGAPNPTTMQPQMLLLYNGGTNSVTPMLGFMDSGDGDYTYSKWYSIGHAFASQYSPNSSWLVSQGINNWGITLYFAFNEPDILKTIPLPSGTNTTNNYYTAMQGLSDGVHSVSNDLKVIPGGFAGPNRSSDWTCGGYVPAIASLLNADPGVSNNGHIDGIDLHTYSGTNTNYYYSCQNTFDLVKSTCGITRDINFYCTEYNYKLLTDTQANAAFYFLTAFWDACGVVGNSGQVVSQLAFPWSPLVTTTQGGNSDGADYGMCTQLYPWIPTPRGSTFQMLSNLTAGMQFVWGDPLGTGVYKLAGNGQVMWVWQDRTGWSNETGTSFTVQQIPLYATTLYVYDCNGVAQTIPLTPGQGSCKVTGLTSGQTYMFIANDQP